MNDIETVKQLETAGFTRRQAETQVQAINNSQKNLMTKQDGELLGIQIANRIEKSTQKLLEGYMTKENGQVLEMRMDVIAERLDTMNERLDILPERLFMYSAKIFGTILGIYPLWLLIKKCLTWLRIL